MLRHEHLASTAPFKLQSSELLKQSVRASYAFADGSCTAGARQLFWGDVHSTTDHFKALFSFLSAEVVFCLNRSRLDTLPTQSRAALISVVACFLPYYDEPEVFSSYSLEDQFSFFSFVQAVCTPRNFCLAHSNTSGVNCVFARQRSTTCAGGL